MEKRLLRMVVGILMVLLTAGIPGIGLRMAAAQDSGLEGDTAYTSPQIGFEVEWDGETWLYLEDSEDESAEGSDHIDVWSLEFLAILHITGFTDAVEPADQVQASLDSTEENTENFELIDQVDGDGVSAAAMTYEVNGEAQLQVVEVVDLDAQYGMEGTLVLQLMTSPDLAEDAVASLKDLVTLEGDPILASDYDGELSLQAGNDDNDANQDDDEDTDSRNQDDEDEDSNQDDEDTTQDDEDEDTDSRNQDDEDEDTDSRDSNAETGIDGNVYTNAEYGFTVEWDEDVWGATESDVEGQAGITLAPIDEQLFGFALVLVYDEGLDDAGDCLEQIETNFSSSEVFLDFSPSRNLDVPETDADAEGGIYTTTFSSQDTEIDLAYYLECREIDGNTIVIQIAVDEEAYEDLLPDIEGLLAGITVGSASTSDDDDSNTRDDDEDDDSNTRDDDEDTQDEDEDTNTRDDDEDQDDDQTSNRGGGETFEDPDNGWTLEYDDSVWALTEVSEEGYQGLALSPTDEDAFGFVSMLVYDNPNIDTAEDCFENLETNLSNSEVFLDFSPARRLDAPETERGAEGGIYTTTYTVEAGEADLAYYIECREIEGGILTIQMAIAVELYEDYLPEFESLLSSIDGGGSSGNSEDEDEESAFLPRNVRFVA